jgi:hypothetical protein
MKGGTILPKATAAPEHCCTLSTAPSNSASSGKSIANRTLPSVGRGHAPDRLDSDPGWRARFINQKWLEELGIDLEVFNQAGWATLLSSFSRARLRIGGEVSLQCCAGKQSPARFPRPSSRGRRFPARRACPFQELHLGWSGTSRRRRCHAFSGCE